MLTVAQMFLLDTCVALYVFLMDVELSCFRHRCLLHGAPTSSLCTTAQHGGDAPSWEDTPLCGCQVAPHPLLDPAEVTWEEAESSSWQVNISKPTSGWILTMQHLKLVGSWGSQHSPALAEIFQVKISFGWISWRRANCWGCSSGANYEPWFCGAFLKPPAGATGSVDSTSHWAAQTLLHVIETQDSPEVLTKLTHKVGTRWSSRPASHPSHSMILWITTMRCFILIFDK